MIFPCLILQVFHRFSNFLDIAPKMSLYFVSVACNQKRVKTGMGSQRCEQGLSAHPPSVDSRRGVCGRLGRPGVGVCIGATAGAGSATDRGGGRGGAAAGNGAGVQDPAGSSPAGAGTRAPSWPGLLTRQLLVFVDGICRRGNLLPITENSMFGLTWEPTKVSSA